jgi:hypothetical protein
MRTYALLGRRHKALQQYALLRKALRRELELYARAGILEYRILNLTKNRHEVYRKPDSEEGRYLELTTLGEGESATPPGLEGYGVTWWD